FLEVSHVATVNAAAADVFGVAAGRLHRRLDVLADLSGLRRDAADPGDGAARAPRGHSRYEDEPPLRLDHGRLREHAARRPDLVRFDFTLRHFQVLSYFSAGARASAGTRNSFASRSKVSATAPGSITRPVAPCRLVHSGSPGVKRRATPGARAPARMRSAAAVAEARMAARSPKCRMSMAMKRCDES